VLAVVLAAVLAASTPPDSGAAPAAADTSVRVTGTSLRFGLALDDVDRRGAFHAAQSPEPGTVARAGRMRFFGVDSDALLVFERGRLATARFSSDAVSPAGSDYIEDQLTRMGFQRRCSLTGDVHSCDWSGRTDVHLQIGAGTLRAEVRPALDEPTPATSHRAPPPHVVPIAAPVAAQVDSGATAPPDTIAFVHPGTAPAVLDSCSAERPAAAREAGIYGRVAVQALVDTSGTVIAAHVTRSVPMLDEAALECARRWRFAPFRVGGRALPYHVAMTIRFAG
jgi:TonB family protein